MDETLPEGTDQIIPGAQNSTTRDSLKADASDMRDQASAKATDFKAQAADKARGYAEEGKARASAGLDSVAKMISDSAAQIDEKLGGNYGDYARKAGDAVSGFSASLRDKDVEELIDDARDLVRRSPAIAIGAAAAAGFVIARIVKAGSEALEQTAKAADSRTSANADDTDEERKPRAGS
jgi:ElaB/YqjD/DUF883 family membrane-anchored ribosome-binding protein